MKNCISALFLIFLFFILTGQLKSQDKKFELQLYTAPFTLIEVVYDSDGPLEYGGPSFEYYLKSNLSIGCSGSWNGSEHYLSQVIIDEESGVDGAYDYHIIQKNRIANVYLRKYMGKSPGTGFFYGPYLRYWYYRCERLDTDLYPPEYRNYFIVNNEPVTYSDHKISIGFLTGIKGEIFDHLTFGISVGGGFSPAFLYLTWEKHFQKEKNGLSLYEKHPTIEHISILSHIFIGYRF